MVRRIVRDPLDWRKSPKKYWVGNNLGRTCSCCGEEKDQGKCGKKSVGCVEPWTISSGPLNHVGGKMMKVGDYVRPCGDSSSPPLKVINIDGDTVTVVADACADQEGIWEPIPREFRREELEICPSPNSTCG